MDLGIYPPHINALRSIQLKKFQYTAKWLNDHTIFYKTKFRKANVDPKDIKSLDDIKKLPFTTKDELNALPNSEICWYPELTLRKHTSSGTTGMPTASCFIDIDLQVMGTLGARSLKLCGCEEGMTLQVNYGYGFFTGGLIFDEAARRLGMKILPQGAAPIDQSIAAMQRFQPEVWCCTPTYAKRVCYYIGDNGIDVSWRIGSHGAEVWTNETRKLIEEGLGPGYKAYDVFGLCEKGGPFVGHECTAQDGSHIWTDVFYMEVLDENGEDVSEGEIGELVLSHIYTGGYSTIRYRTGDKVKLVAENDCVCFASGYPRIQILGRKVKDEFKVGGTFLIRSDLENVAVNTTRKLHELFGADIGEFRVELSSLEGTTDVRYCVELADPENAEQKSVVKSVVRDISRHMINRSFPVKTMEIGTYEQSLGKTKLIIDKRTEESQ